MILRACHSAAVYFITGPSTVPEPSAEVVETIKKRVKADRDSDVCCRAFELQLNTKAKGWLLREAARTHPSSAKTSDSEGTNVWLFSSPPLMRVNLSLGSVGHGRH
jgi:hypothetical protein